MEMVSMEPSGITLKPDAKTGFYNYKGMTFVLQEVTVKEEIKRYHIKGQCDLELKEQDKHFFEALRQYLKKDKNDNYFEYFTCACPIDEALLDIPKEINGKPVAELSTSWSTAQPVLKDIIIPDSILSIDGNIKAIFIDAKDLKVSIDPNNPEFKMIDGNICTKDGKTLLVYIRKSEKSDIMNIPDGICVIAEKNVTGSHGYYKDYSGVILPLSIRKIAYDFLPTNCQKYYFKGTKEDWKKKKQELRQLFEGDSFLDRFLYSIFKSKRPRVVYFYSEKQAKNCWHFAADGVTPILW